MLKKQVHFFDNKITLSIYTYKNVAYKKNILNLDEEKIYHSFTNKDLALKFFYRHLILKKILLKYNIPNHYIVYNQFGKPYLKNTDFFFSTSHSLNFFCIAISKDFELGIDIEDITRKVQIEKIYKYCFSKKDKEYIHAIPNLHHRNKVFFTYWTQKEAYTKLHGLGLSIPLSKIQHQAKFLKSNNESTIHSIEEYLLHVDNIPNDTAIAQAVSCTPKPVITFFIFKNVLCSFCFRAPLINSEVL